MLRKKIVFAAIAAFSMALASGCHLYIDDGDDGFPGDGDGDRDDGWVNPGDDCSADADICAPGCVCTADDFGSYCEETGFCDDEFPCPEGYVCERDADGDGVAETCVEEGDPGPSCTDDAGCDLGSICDAAEGECRPAVGCEEHRSKESCDADPANECEGINRGINCTHPTGGDCELDPEPCTCESFEFAACVDVSAEG